MRTFALSNIHGCLTTFRKLLLQIQFDKTDELYVLGGLIDRGPDAKGLMDGIWELQENGFRIHCLQGPHEQGLIEAYRHGNKQWRYQEGYKTLYSFGVEKVEDIPSGYIRFLEELPAQVKRGKYLLAAQATEPEEKGQIVLHGHAPTKSDALKEQFDFPAAGQVLSLDGGCPFYQEGLGNLAVYELNSGRLYCEPNAEHAPQTPHLDKVLFLDINGVLQTGREIDGTLEGYDRYGLLFNEACVRNLQRILKETGAKIVVSSSWRWMGLDRLRELWSYRQLPGEIVDHTLFQLYNFQLSPRGREIQEWLNRNTVGQYVIVDNRNEFFGEQLDHFVQTNELKGLTDEVSDRMIEILNRPAITSFETTIAPNPRRLLYLDLHALFDENGRPKKALEGGLFQEHLKMAAFDWLACTRGWDARIPASPFPRPMRRHRALVYEALSSIFTDQEWFMKKLLLVYDSEQRGRYFDLQADWYCIDAAATHLEEVHGKEWLQEHWRERIAPVDDSGDFLLDWVKKSCRALERTAG
jgi:serine/threonine protein phosphatase 1